MLRTLPARAADGRRLVTRWDLLAILLVLGLVAFLGEASRGVLEPLAKVETASLSLSPSFLPEYAARTTLRMLAGLVLWNAEHVQGWLLPVVVMTPVPLRSVGFA